MSAYDIPDLICADDLPMSGDCIEDATTAVIAAAVAEANLIIYRMSGGRVYGIRDVTVRPMVDCSFSGTPPAVTLPGNVQRIRWVMIDGVVLSPEAYRIADRTKLIRVDGSQWPTTQDLTKTLSEAGTFAVRYSYGAPVDDVTRRAAIDTAIELVKLTVPDTTGRRLPPNVRSASGSGVSLSMQDRNQLIRELGSYLESVNRFMALHNPRAELETFVYSPDTSPRLHSLDRNG